MMTAPYLTGCTRLRLRRLLPGLLAGAVLAVPAAAGAATGGASGGGGGLGAPPAGKQPAGHGDTLLIRGSGDGHGVGMSQFGAEGEALHGLSDAAILAHYYTGTALGHVDPDRAVSVLLGTGRASFSGASAAGRVRLSPRTTYTVTAAGVGLRIATPAGHTVLSAAGTLTVTGEGPLTTDGRRYRGALRFSAPVTGGVQTVNVLGLDDYVRGVVAGEMNAGWSPAALEAQAIAARTYALTTSVGGAGYDLYDDTRSQVYGGVGAETATTDAAVAATSGQVVTYGGLPVITYFFASSGGYTESIQNVWTTSPDEPWLVGVPDPYDDAAGNPYSHWERTLSLQAATRKLGSLVSGRLQRIVVTRRGISPRVVSAQVVGSGGTTSVTGTQLAGAFGLPSTWMSFTVT